MVYMVSRDWVQATAEILMESLLAGGDFDLAQATLEILHEYGTHKLAGIYDQAFLAACRVTHICPVCGSSLTTRSQIINYGDRPFGEGVVPEYADFLVCPNGCVTDESLGGT